MAKTNTLNSKDSKRQLVEQVAASPYFSKSVRLRDMFLYVCGRVLDHDADEIHEQEVGRKVFGRPPDYDTSSDNTVRVHASMLRKRVDQYFAKEGSSEPLIIEIPRGNYAPVFRERTAIPDLPPLSLPESVSIQPPQANWALWTTALLAVIFAVISLSLFLHIRREQQKADIWKSQPAVHQFWSQVFQKNKPSDIVLGDAGLALFEEKTGRPIALSDYFDRSYFNTAEGLAAGNKLDPDLAKTLLLRRQSNYGDVSLLLPITDMGRSVQSDTKIRFARDYSFRELKADNAILLGNLWSNPWIEPFHEHQTLRWQFDADHKNYYPVDSAAPASEQTKYNPAIQTTQPHESYVTISLFPNMGGTGSVLIISGTGGTAMTGTLSFLTDEGLMQQLRTQLGAAKGMPFPYFEALLKIGSRNTLPREVNIIIARRLHS